MGFVLKLRKALLFDTTIHDPDRKIRQQIVEDNRRFGIIWSFAALLYWGFCFGMSFREERFHLCRYVYVACMALSMISLLMAMLLVRKKPFLILFVKIIFSAALLGGGLCIAWILLQHDYKTITIFASVLLVPVLFNNNTLYNIVMVLIHILSAIVLMRFGLSREIYIWCITDLIIFSSIGVLLGHYVNKARFERYEFAESAVQLAELQTRYANYDLLSGLLNRRAYSEKIEALAKVPPAACGVVMADINGLKKMNDTLGHEAGDELIVGTARCLRSVFEGVDTIYRLGGDEFGVILVDSSLNVEACLKRLEQTAAGWNGQYVHGISISCGYASTEDSLVLKDIVRLADQRMYDAKRSYYAVNGKDSDDRRQ